MNKTKINQKDTNKLNQEHMFLQLKWIVKD